MRSLVLASSCAILLRFIPLSYGFTLPQYSQSPIHHPVEQQSVRRNTKKLSMSFINRIEDYSKRMFRTNEFRIRQELHAVNVEQESDVQEQQQISTSISGGMNNDFDSDNNVYELLGIEEGQLALGVKPEEVYKYVGTREELISKTLTDIPALTREMAEKEVDKFLMDCEMVNLYIQYGKEVEKDPNFVVPDNDNDDSNNWFTPRNIVAGYLTYVGVTSGPQIIRRYVAEQEVKGEWHPTNIKFIDQWIDNTSADATARVLQKAAEKAAKIASSSAVESTTSNIDAITSSSSASVLPTDMITPDAVVDSVQSLVDTITAVTP